MNVVRRFDNADDWANYRTERNKAVSALRSAKSEFHNSSFEENKNNTRVIWKAMQTLTGSERNTKEVKKLNVDGRDVEDFMEMAACFNAYFSTIADKLREGLRQISFDFPKLSNSVNSRKGLDVVFSVPAIKSVEVNKIILTISPDKAAGIDKATARLQRLAAPVVAPSIAKLINLSFSTGTFPSRWKIAKVTPLYKNGAECDPCNYRPISVLLVLSKVIERHMHNTLYTFLCDNYLIFSRQSGFRKTHSTETALIKIIDDLLFNLDRDRVSGVVLIYYCKAFDMVDHELLLKKLEAYGIVNTELRWCRSYLTGRKQVVILGGKESSEARMEDGVPQGSILGPLFFILFINDLPLHVSSQVDLYANDTTLTASAHFNNLPELQLSLNISANKIRHWADSNKLPINESKSKVLTNTGKCLASKINDELVVTVEENILVNVKSATLLGLTIDSSLSFDCHVENLCNKLAAWIGVLSKIRTFLSLKQRLLFYNYSPSNELC